MIAEIRPQTGGAPEAIAIPSESGIPIMATWSPAIRSYRQCFSPFTPFSGFSIGSSDASIASVCDPCDDMLFLLNSVFLEFAETIRPSYSSDGDGALLHLLKRVRPVIGIPHIGTSCARPNRRRSIPVERK